jgi:hypothetical protein
MATSSATTNTKSRFGVPLTGATGSGILAPKLKYRFRVSFLNNFGGAAETKTLTQNIQSVGRPTMTAEEVEVHSYNSRVYIQGKHSWGTIDVAIRDDITNSVSKLVGAQVQRQINHFQQTTPAAANDFKFDMQIEVLDGVNAGSTEVWFLEGCFLTNVAYGDHEYSGNDVQTITMTVRFDNALHFQGDNSVNGRVRGGNPFPLAVGTGINTIA